MKFNSLFVVAIVLAAGVSVPVKAASEIPAYITAAIADPGRPPEDKAQDVNRKPAEVLAFAGIKPGDKVVDLLPGSGYYTRIFSKIVGPKGVVYALQPTEIDKIAPKRLQALKALADTPAYANVVVLAQPVAAIAIPQHVDMVWTSQNYHDLHNPLLGSPNMANFNKSIFNALKPGGIFLVLDHAATAGSGVADTNTLHRIDPALVKTEVTAAGFEFVGDSDVLRSPDDNHSLPIFDKSIKGKTDKFIEKFRKPMQ
jgi:predicted methyltransferase